MDSKTMGQIICEYRKHKKLTQKALAEQLHVTDKAVSKWERDIARPSIDIIPEIAKILDIPVEVLLNISVTEQNDQSSSLQDNPEENIAISTFNEEEEWDPVKEMHKENVRHLLSLGLIGFAAGFLLVLIQDLSDNDQIHIINALLMGVSLAGVPYGWELLGKIIGNWYVVGSIPIMIIVFILKLTGAVLIGWAAFPIALLYNLINICKKGSKGRLVFTSLLIGFIALIVLFFVWTALLISNRENGSDNIPTSSYSQEEITPDATNASSAPLSQLVVDGSVFNTTNATYITVCENALAKSIAEEKQDSDYGYEILTPSSVKAAYFLSVTIPGTQHNDYGDNVRMSNAILVVTSYTMEITPGIEREEFMLWIYPDFFFSNNSLQYDAESEHEDFLGCETVTDVYEWICEEYDDMTITELDIP